MAIWLRVACWISNASLAEAHASSHAPTRTHAGKHTHSLAYTQKCVRLIVGFVKHASVLRFIIRTLPVVSSAAYSTHFSLEGNFFVVVCLCWHREGCLTNVSFLFLFCPVVSCRNAPLKGQHLAQILSFFHLPYKSYSMLPIILRSSLAILDLASKETLKEGRAGTASKPYEQ